MTGKPAEIPNMEPERGPLENEPPLEAIYVSWICLFDAWNKFQKICFPNDQWIFQVPLKGGR